MKNIVQSSRSLPLSLENSLLQHEVTVSPIGLDEAQHPVLANINVRDVDLEGGYDSRAPQKIELSVTKQKS